MRMPRKPPKISDLMVEMPTDRLMKAINSAQSDAAQSNYLHWDKMVYLTPPDGLTSEEWWAGTKVRRQSLYQPIPLTDKTGNVFRFLVTEPIPEQLHLIDLSAGGKIGVPSQVINSETRSQYYVSSLMEEAITSSQLEGATTTREVAKDMIRTSRAPRNRSEQMILNNYQTMQRIGTLKDEPLTRDLVLELHRLVTDNALDNPGAVGRFRLPEEDIVVEDQEGEVFHVPPSAGELEERMSAMCDFANGLTPDYFIHPAIRSITLHFWLAYDHPFVDGNGRTARALFYWSMLRSGFWLCEFISISHILVKAPVKYARAFLYTETDDNDLTYFILHQIEVLRQALIDLEHYIKIKAERLNVVERDLKNIALLNPRQRALVSHALRHLQHRYTTEQHRVSHNVAYQTARNDLMDLVHKSLFDTVKSGKTWYFRPVQKLGEKLTMMN